MARRISLADDRAAVGAGLEQGEEADGSRLGRTVFVVSSAGPRPGRADAFRRSWWKGDLLVGVSEAAYLVPQVMAYAGVAGLPPAAGLSIRRLSSSPPWPGVPVHGQAVRPAAPGTAARRDPRYHGRGRRPHRRLAPPQGDQQRAVGPALPGPPGLGELPHLVLPALSSSMGARSHAHSLAAGAAVLAVLRFLSPLLARTPSAVLGALVMYAAVRMIDVAGLPAGVLPQTGTAARSELPGRGTRVRGDRGHRPVDGRAADLGGAPARRSGGPGAWRGRRARRGRLPASPYDPRAAGPPLRLGAALRQCRDLPRPGPGRRRHPGQYVSQSQPRAALRTSKAEACERLAAQIGAQLAHPVHEGGADRRRRDDAVQRPVAGLGHVQGLGEQVGEVVDTGAVVAQDLGEGVVLLPGPLGPQNVVEEQGVDVARVRRESSRPGRCRITWRRRPTSESTWKEFMAGVPPRAGWCARRAEQVCGRDTHTAVTLCSGRGVTVSTWPEVRRFTPLVGNGRRRRPRPVARSRWVRRARW